MDSSYLNAIRDWEIKFHMTAFCTWRGEIRAAQEDSPFESLGLIDWAHLPPSETCMIWAEILQTMFACAGIILNLLDDSE